MIENNLHETAYPKLTESQIDALEKFTVSKSFQDGEKLFEAGKSYLKFFVVKSGKVEIYENSNDRKKTVIVHEEKEFTGDVNLLSDKPSLVTAIARDSCQVYEISIENFKKIINEIPDIGDCILQAFLSRRELLQKSGFAGFKVVGSRYSQDTFRIKDFLSRNKIPFTWIDIEKDRATCKLLKHFDISSDELPVVAFKSNKILKNPSNLELGKLVGIKKSFEDKVYDLAIVGAGPAGLAAAVYGASEGLETVVLEKTAPGGQASCSSKIENYMGFPTGLTGADLANRALIQAQKFGTQFSTPAKVIGLECNSSYKVLKLANGESVSSKCVLIATGVSYRKLNVEGCKKFEGSGVYYSATKVEAQMCRESTVVIVGGGNSAGQAAIFLSEYAHQVMILIRGDSLGKSMSQYLLKRLEQINNIELLANTEINKICGDEAVHSVEIKNNKNQKNKTVKTSAIFIFIGAVPSVSWLPLQIEVDDKGFVKTGLSVVESDYWSASRQPFLLETSCPGIFAAGDVRADSIKRVASAVGEGSMTVKFVHQFFS